MRSIETLRYKKIYKIFTRVLLFLVIALAYITVGFKQLGKLANPIDLPIYLKIDSMRSLIENVPFFPFRALQFFVNHFFSGQIVALTLVSVMLAVLSLFIFYYVLIRWRSKRVALMGTFLLGTTGLFLVAARSVEPYIYYVFSACLIPLCFLIISEEGSKYDLLFISVILALLLYTPGFWIFILIGLALAYSSILNMLSEFSIKQKALAFLAFILGILPLISSFIINPLQIKGYLLGSSYNIVSIKLALDNALALPSQLVYSGLDDISVWLPNTPVIDVFTLAMIVLGIYAYKIGYHPVRFKGLIIFTLVSTVLAIVNGQKFIWVLIVPLILFATRGIGLMLQQWFAVFPKNPLARYVGVIVLCIALGTAGVFHLNRYFNAWPAYLSKTNHHRQLN